MSNAAKRKGTQWESDLVGFLSGVFRGLYGLVPRRVAQSGPLDTGDLHGISPFVGQAKNYANLADGLRLGLEGAEVQRRRAGEAYGVAFVKRVRKSVGEGYAVMTISTFARLVLRLRRAETLLSEVSPASFATHVDAANRDANA